MDTEVLPLGEAAIVKAASLIRAGYPVAVPTETVYGLAADATSGLAVARIFEAKGRPAFNPLIVHVLDLAEAERIGTFRDAARRLAERWWPGPLTLVLPRAGASPVAELATAALSTVALRCPAHPAMQALLRTSGRPLAAPSANVSGSISPTSAVHVVKTLGGRIPLLLDGGNTAHGLESTIVAVGETIRLLRPGPIGFDALVEQSHLEAAPAREAIEAPGQLASHYAPAKPLRLDAIERHAGEYLIGFGSIAGDEMLSASSDLVEAAANLFGALHRADAATQPRIAVAPIPARGLGAAINDRLRRAAAPRGA